MTDTNIRIVMAPAGNMALPAIECYLNSPNTFPVDVFDLGDMSDEARDFCEDHPRITLHDVAYLAQDAKEGRPHFSMRQAGWFCKPQVMGLSPADIAVWIDHDLVVQGDLTPMVEAFAASGHWFGSPFYSSFCDRYKGSRICQHGIVIYRPDSNGMRQWVQDHTSRNDPNDEKSWFRFFKAKDAFDLYRPEWYYSPDVGWTGGNGIRSIEELSQSRAVTVHYPSPSYKSACVKHMKRTAEPRKQGTTDLVIPLGNKSIHNNNEIRFLLRSAERNMTDLRNVIVVGHKPDWLTGVTHIPIKDHAGPKDLNIARKILSAAIATETSDTFVWACDDQLFLSPGAGRDIPVTYVREYTGDTSQFLNSVWHQRLVATLADLGPGSRYVEPHKPMPVNKADFVRIMGDPAGWPEHLIINSYYFNRAGVEMVLRDDDDKHVMLAQKPKSVGAMTSKMIGKDFLGYHDGVINPELTQWIAAQFPVPSRFESDNGAGAWKPGESSMSSPVDVVIVASKQHTDEDIRLALRSINECLTDRGNVILVGREVPGLVGVRQVGAWSDFSPSVEHQNGRLAARYVEWSPAFWLHLPCFSDALPQDNPFPVVREASKAETLLEPHPVTKAMQDSLRELAGKRFRVPSCYEHLHGGTTGKDTNLIMRAIQLARALPGESREILRLRKNADRAEQLLDDGPLGCDDRTLVNMSLLVPLRNMITQGRSVKRQEPPEAAKPRTPCKGCGDRRKAKGEATAATEPAATQIVTAETGPTGERNCLECCQKHLERAIVYLGEYATNPDYRLELRRARGNIGLAEDHAVGVDTAIAQELRRIRLMVSPGGTMDIANTVRLIDRVCEQIDTLMEAGT